MDIKELKAQAYDILVQIEQLQLQLRNINQQIIDSKNENPIAPDIAP